MKRSDGINIQLTGDKDLIRLLNKMQFAATEKFVIDSMKEAAKPGIKKVKEDTKEGPTGNLKRSIGFKKVKGSGPINYSAIVGARFGRGKWKEGTTSYNSGHHAHLYAWGHRAWGKVWIPGKGDWINRGMQPTVPFMTAFLTKQWVLLMKRTKKKYKF